MNTLNLSSGIDDQQDIGSANPPIFKLSTIMWGVFLGNLLTGIAGGVLYAAAYAVLR
jgi:hypothetical protein